MSKKKTNAQLEEENAQLEAELSAVLDEVEELKSVAREELAALKEKLSAQTEANEILREEELNAATAGYEALYERATAAINTQRNTDPKLLGIAAQCAREGIISTLEGIFGDL